jgi:acid phosphatase family membrane protein YuiD
MRREWDWGLLIAAGGMPSSHSALVTGVSVGIGLQEGFGSPLFAIAGIVAMIVIYDATGVRRHAGDHARVLNLMIDELLTGHPLAEKELKEVLGHTPREVIGGVVLGLVMAYLIVRVI